LVATVGPSIAVAAPNGKVWTGTHPCPRSISTRLRLDASTGYLPPHNKADAGRARKRLGRAAGITQFGVNLTTLEPGAASSQRHWHEQKEEFVYGLQGEVVLCEDGGETMLNAGDAAAWKAGVPVTA
jgi:uncharacterized cupin superfamily protein